MQTRSLRRKVLLLLLVAVFAMPWAASARHAFFDPLWSILRSLWSEEGCGIDPDGHCLAAPVPQPPVTIHSKEGCHIDPDGRYIVSPPPSTIQTDTGCHIDPNGRCHS